MKSAARTIGSVMIIMMFSRLAALAANQVYITYFGINLEMDVYSYATQLPNIVFNSIGTALATVVIPIFAGYMGTGEKERAEKFADNILGLSLLITVILSIGAILAAPAIIQLTRFRSSGYDFALTALRIMFPVMIFYAMNYILQGVLQSLGSYRMPAVVSLPGSLIIIIYVFVLGDRYGVGGLLGATFIGLVLQALILVPPVYKANYRIRPSFDYRSDDIKSAIKLIVPVLIGTSAYQMNLLFNATLSANFKDTVALMITVQNLVFYAVLVLIYSITSVVFPRLTMLAAKNDMDSFKSELAKILRFIIYFMVPVTVGFIAVRYQLINLLYGWGKVTDNNVSMAGSLMAFYALGVTGVGIKEVLDRAFYSLKDTRKPAFNGIIMMAVNIVSSIALISVLGVFGIPLAYSISAAAGSLILIFLLKRKIGSFGIKGLVFSFIKTVISAVGMFIILLPLNSFMGSMTLEPALLDKGLKLIVPVVAGGAVYFLLTLLLKVEETLLLVNSIKSRLGLA